MTHNFIVVWGDNSNSFATDKELEFWFPEVKIGSPFIPGGPKSGFSRLFDNFDLTEIILVQESGDTIKIKKKV